MADRMDVRPRAFGSSFLAQASVKDASGAASSDHSFLRSDVCKTGHGVACSWACSKTNRGERLGLEEVCPVDFAFLAQTGV